MIVILYNLFSDDIDMCSKLDWLVVVTSQSVAGYSESGRRPESILLRPLTLFMMQTAAILWCRDYH